VYHCLASLAHVALVGFGIQPDGETIPYFVAGFFSAGLVWSAGVAAMSSLSGSFFKKSMVRVLSFLSALLFLYFAVKVFYGGLKDILA